MFRTELRALLRLSGPLIASYAGQQCMSLVDTVLVGRLGKASLGGVGVGNGIFSAMLVTGIGLVLGLDPLISQALGAGEARRARVLLWQGLRVAVLAGLVMTALVCVAPLVLAPAGVAPETASEARRYLFARAPGLLPFLLFSASRAYLQASGVTWPIVVATIVANITNLAVGWALLAPLGVVGPAIATSVSTLLMLVIAALAIRRMQVPAADTVAAPGEALDLAPVRAYRPDLARAVFWLGGPIALQLLAEVGVFAIAGVLAGRLGEDAAAAHQVAIVLASTTFTVTLGIGAATAVRVGKAVGAEAGPAAVRRAGMAGLVACWSFMVLAALAFFVIPGVLSGWLTDDVVAARAAVPLVLIAALFQLSDGTQCVAAGALRGAGDTSASLAANVIGHYGIGLPLSLILAFRLGWGAPGLWWGLSAGLTSVGIGLVWRFLLISRGTIRRAL